MLCHLVFYQMKNGTNGADADRLIREARERLPKLPGVLNLKAGKNIDSSGKHQVALSMDFADVETLEVYRVHPDHRAFVNDMAELVSDISRYDFLWE